MKLVDRTDDRQEPSSLPDHALLKWIESVGWAGRVIKPSSGPYTGWSLYVRPAGNDLPPDSLHWFLSLTRVPESFGHRLNIARSQLAR